MIKKYKILVTVFVLATYSATGQINIDLNGLMSKDISLKTKTLDAIVKSKDTKYYPLLEAISNKKLYRYDNQYVTIGKKYVHNKIVSYEIVLLYPESKTMLNGKRPLALPLDKLESIRFSRAARLKIIPLAPFINLRSSVSDTRKLAYTQFLNTLDIKDLKLITDASKHESDEEIIRLSKETSMAIQLFNSTDKQEQIQLVKALSDNLGDNTIFLLEKFKKEKKFNGSLEATIEDELSHLKGRAWRISFFQNIFSGVSLGSILILIALGLAIIYGLAGVINMAHGEFMMIGAYSTYIVQELFKIFSGPVISDGFFWLSIPFSFVVSGIFGLLIEKLIIEKLYRNPIKSLLATWGISLVLIQLARTIFGDLTTVKAPRLLTGGWHIVPQLVLPYSRLFIIVIMLVLIGSTYYFLFKTRYGLLIRSVTQNRNMSACLGISTKKIDSLTFFIGAGIAGVAGTCMTLIGNIVPDMGQTYIVDSFLVVVSGGVGNLLGTILAGLGIGQITKLLEPIFQAVYGKVIILSIIILFLQYKPKGLFAPKGRISDD